MRHGQKKFLKAPMMRIGIVACLASLSIGGCADHRKGHQVPAELIRTYANALYNQGLYAQAIAEYQRYFDQVDLNTSQRANIVYTMANIYFERLHDYENALALYLKVKHVYPETSFLGDVEKRIVACLERLGRSADAKQALSEATALEPERIPRPQPGTVIARIGEREITTGDLEHTLRRLPASVKERFQSREARLDLLRQMITTDLFYEAAKRAGLDTDKEVIEGAFEAKKALMVQKYLEGEIGRRVTLSPDHVRDYYEAYRDRYAEKDSQGKIRRERPFEEVKDRVAEDLAKEKQARAYQELLDQIMRAERVEIFADRLP